jgi:serine acetyltransferase
VVGARALVNRSIPPCVVAAGVPARVLREGVSWGRDRNAMTQAERAMLDLPPLAAG